MKGGLSVIVSLLLLTSMLFVSFNLQARNTYNHFIASANSPTHNPNASVYGATLDYETTSSADGGFTINLQSPDNGTTTMDNMPDFKFVATYLSQLTFCCSLWLQNTTFSNVYAAIDDVVNGSLTTMTPSPPIPNGDWWWWINCTDGSTSSMSDKRRITINLFRGDKTFTASYDGSTRYYWLDLPDDFDNSTPTPLVFYLHGYGGSRTSYLEQFPVLGQIFQNHTWIVATIDCREIGGYDDWYTEPTRRDITDVLNILKHDYSIDSNHIHIMGTSMGGDGSLAYAMFNSEVIASLVDVYGITNFTQFYAEAAYFRTSLEAAFGGEPSQVPEVYANESALGNEYRFRHIPVMMIHGDADTTVNVNQSRNLNQSLSALGYTVKYVEVPGGEHGASIVYGREMEIFEWFNDHPALASAWELTVVSAHGSPSPGVGDHFYTNGTSVTCNVTSPVIESSVSYTCTGWTGTGSVPASGTTNSTTFLITANSTITWNWIVTPPVQWNLTVISAHGSPSPGVGDHTYNDGSSITCSITSPVTEGSTVWTCTGWTGSGSVPTSGSGSSTGSFNMTSDSSITWNWQGAVVQYGLLVGVSGSGTTNATGTTVYPSGTMVAVNATPSPGWNFKYWLLNGTGTSSANPHVITMNGNYNLTAVFVQVQYLVVRGNDDRIYYRVHTSSSWTDWNNLPGATPDSPAAAVCNNKLYIVVRGLDGSSLWYGYVDLGTSSFSNWALLSGATSSAPTLTSNGTTLCLVVRGEDNLIYYRFYNDSSWGDWATLPSGATLDSPAAAMLGNELHIVVRGMAGYSLWHSYVSMSNNSFSEWTLLSGATQSKPVLAADQAETKLFLAVRGLDDRIYWRTYDAIGQSWADWSVLYSGATPEGPATTIFGGAIQIVVQGMDGSSIWQGNIDLSTTNFSGWTLLSGATPSAPTLTS